MENDKKHSRRSLERNTNVLKKATANSGFKKLVFFGLI